MSLEPRELVASFSTLARQKWKTKKQQRRDTEADTIQRDRYMCFIRCNMKVLENTVSLHDAKLILLQSFVIYIYVFCFFTIRFFPPHNQFESVFESDYIFVCNRQICIIKENLLAKLVVRSN